MSSLTMAAIALTMVAVIVVLVVSSLRNQNCSIDDCWVNGARSYVMPVTVITCAAIAIWAIFEAAMNHH